MEIARAMRSHSITCRIVIYFARKTRVARTIENCNRNKNEEIISIIHRQLAAALYFAPLIVRISILCDQIADLHHTWTHHLRAQSSFENCDSSDGQFTHFHETCGYRFQ